MMIAALALRPAASSAPSAPDASPVVLELFTSEGCSSCPPADALLSKIGSSGRGVIPLAYHVDYWDHLGWSDPFSSRQFSERQSAYAGAMGLDGEYTPQMVIGGTSQCVGSDARSIAGAIAASRSSPALGRVSVRVVPEAPGSRALRIKVTAEVPRASSTGPLSLMVAIYENGLVSKIGGGENGGRELTYDYTVRKLMRVAELDGAHGAIEKELSIELDPSWSPGRLGVAAFLQEASSLRIDGAGVQYPIVSN